MVSFYGGWFLFVLLYGLLRGRVRGFAPSAGGCVGRQPCC